MCGKNNRELLDKYSYAWRAGVVRSVREAQCRVEGKLNFGFSSHGESAEIRSIYSSDSSCTSS